MLTDCSLLPIAAGKKWRLLETDMTLTDVVVVTTVQFAPFETFFAGEGGKWA